MLCDLDNERGVPVNEKNPPTQPNFLVCDANRRLCPIKKGASVNDQRMIPNVNPIVEESEDEKKGA